MSPKTIPPIRPSSPKRVSTRRSRTSGAPLVRRMTSPPRLGQRMGRRQTRPRRSRVASTRHWCPALAPDRAGGRPPRRRRSPVEAAGAMRRSPTWSGDGEKVVVCSSGHSEHRLVASGRAAPAERSPVASSAEVCVWSGVRSHPRTRVADRGRISCRTRPDEPPATLGVAAETRCRPRLEPPGCHKSLSVHGSPNRGHRRPEPGHLGGRCGRAHGRLGGLAAGGRLAVRHDARTTSAQVDEDVLDLGVEVEGGHPELAPDARTSCSRRTAPRCGPSCSS